MLCSYKALGRTIMEELYQSRHCQCAEALAAKPKEGTRAYMLMGALIPTSKRKRPR